MRRQEDREADHNEQDVRRKMRNEDPCPGVRRKGWDGSGCSTGMAGAVHPELWIRLSRALKASDRQGCKSYGAPLGPLLLPLLWPKSHKSNWRSDCYWVLTQKLWQWHGSRRQARDGSAFMGKRRELSSLAKAGHGGGRGGSIEIYSRRVLKRICAFGERDFALGSRREQSPGRLSLVSRPRQRSAQFSVSLTSLPDVRRE